MYTKRGVFANTKCGSDCSVLFLLALPLVSPLNHEFEMLFIFMVTNMSWFDLSVRGMHL